MNSETDTNSSTSAEPLALPPDSGSRLVPLLGIACYLGIAGAFVYFGRVNTDEGMHLQAGRLMVEGARLYRDFPFGQGPGSPAFYGLMQVIFSETLLTGRVASAACNLAGIGALAFLCHRLAGPLAVVLSLACISSTASFFVCVMFSLPRGSWQQLLGLPEATKPQRRSEAGRVGGGGRSWGAPQA